MTTHPTLHRSVALTPLVFYGLGTMVGGGFYALLGRIAGLAGYLAPVAFAAAGLLALLSAASFAELSSRFPVSAGEVEYVWRGFGRRELARTVGWLVILTGVVSAATLAVATVGFLGDLVAVPEGAAVVTLVVAMGLLAAWGIGESVGLVFAITLVEVGALVAAALLAGDGVGVVDRWLTVASDAGAPAADGPDGINRWTGVFSGAFLAFYAFIGFEDMVNIAEEVKRPRRNLPIAIMVSVVATTLLYIWTAVVAVTTVPPAALAAARTPLGLLVTGAGRYATTGIVVVSLLAGMNGALVQIIMASRVAYGMARRGWASPWFGLVDPRTRTPLVGTAIMTGVIAALAILFPLTALARSTSAIMLVNFTAVNLSLWRLKGTTPDIHGDGPRLPRWLPLVAAGSCIGVLLVQGWTALT